MKEMLTFEQIVDLIDVGNTNIAARGIEAEMARFGIDAEKLSIQLIPLMGGFSKLLAAEFMTGLHLGLLIAEADNG